MKDFQELQNNNKWEDGNQNKDKYNFRQNSEIIGRGINPDCF